MTLELKITLQGQEDSLQRHHLSLSRLGESLPNLLNALRRVASGGRGRFSNEARELDLELTAISSGSVGLDFVVQHHDSEFAVLAANRLIDELEEPESPVPAVRKLIGSWADGVDVARVSLLRGGTIIRCAELETLTVVDPRKVPFILSGVADLVEAGFSEGRQWVKVHFREAKKTKKFFVTRDSDFELAVDHRSFFVRGVISDQNRLISIDTAAPEPLSPDERKSWALERWSEVLERLSK